MHQEISILLVALHYNTFLIFGAQTLTIYIIILLLSISLALSLTTSLTLSPDEYIRYKIALCFVFEWSFNIFNTSSLTTFGNFFSFLGLESSKSIPSLFKTSLKVSFIAFTAWLASEFHHYYFYYSYHLYHLWNYPWQ